MAWLLRPITALGFVLLSANAHAGVVYTAIHQESNTWRLDYEVTNDLSVGIDGFTLFFDRAMFSSLSGASGPEGWDLLVSDPDLDNSADGIFDALILDPFSPLSPGASAGTFSLLAQFSGVGAPGSQLFEFYCLACSDEGTFAVLYQGETSPSSVPEPGMPALFATGLLGMLLARRRFAVPCQADPTATLVGRRTFNQLSFG